MKEKLLLLGWCVLFLQLAGCGSKDAGAGGKKPALVVNKLQLTQEELKKEYQSSLLSGHPFQETKSQEPEWLSRVIERELLVQEAQRLGLDRNPDFMKTIERFWKEALIKTLLDRKTEEIGGRIHVYEPEIEAAYKKMTEENAGKPLEPLSELRGEIRREIRQNKETEAMELWVSELRREAKIVTDEESLAGLK